MYIKLDVLLDPPLFCQGSSEIVVSACCLSLPCDRIGQLGSLSIKESWLETAFFYCQVGNFPFFLTTTKKTISQPSASLCWWGGGRCLRNIPLVVFGLCCLDSSEFSTISRIQWWMQGWFCEKTTAKHILPSSPTLPLISLILVSHRRTQWFKNPLPRDWVIWVWTLVKRVGDLSVFNPLKKRAVRVLCWWESIPFRLGLFSLSHSFVRGNSDHCPYASQHVCWQEGQLGSQRIAGNKMLRDCEAWWESNMCVFSPQIGMFRAGKRRRKLFFTVQSLSLMWIVVIMHCKNKEISVKWTK